MGSLNAGMGNDRACGLATIMGIGKAVPEHVVPWKSFPDFYFEISNSNHMVELKAKFAKICKWKHACMHACDLYYMLYVSILEKSIKFCIGSLD